MMQIYLDYSATTPCRPEVMAAMNAAWQLHWGNPASLHEWGQRSAMVLEEARLQVADLVHAPADAIVFTSGGTEANNFALLGIAQQYETPQHLIISSVEHPAIAEPARQLEQQGWQVTRLPVNRAGLIQPQSLKDALQANTVLVSVIWGQSEVGTLQPIQMLAQVARDHGVLFHTDAVQVAGRLPIDVQTLSVDLLSLSSHKIYGPQGAGALYVRPGVDLCPLLVGGGQERGLRSGTPAVPLLAGFGVAARLAAAELEQERERLVQLRDRLFDQLSHLAYLDPTGDREHRLPHHLSFCIPSRFGVDISGRAIVRQMNLAGIAISAGSACHSGTLAPSDVLGAMGYDNQTALSSIRMTLGKQTNLADMDWTSMVLQQVLQQVGLQSRLHSSPPLALAADAAHE